MNNGAKWRRFIVPKKGENHKAGQSAFLHTQLYLSTNLDRILFSNVSWHIAFLC